MLHEFCLFLKELTTEPRAVSARVQCSNEHLVDWSNASQFISKYQKTSDHRLAQQRNVELLRICKNEELGIVQHMTKAQL